MVCCINKYQGIQNALVGPGAFYMCHTSATLTKGLGRVKAVYVSHFSELTLVTSDTDLGPYGDGAGKSRILFQSFLMDTVSKTM